MLHPHPRVTAGAKTRNRRAACPLPQAGEGSYNRSCPRAFDFVRVAHCALKMTASAVRAGKGAITFTSNF